jgi:hypothetical protein
MRLNDAIASACEQLGVSYQENFLWFEILSRQVFKTFKSYKVFKTKTVDIELFDGKALLPDDFISIVSVGGEECTSYCEGRDYDVMDNYIAFCSDNGLEDGDEVSVTYKALATDSNGDPIIPDDWERMLVGYFCWKYTLKHFKIFNQFVIDQYKREYTNQKQALV